MIYYIYFKDLLYQNCLFQKTCLVLDDFQNNLISSTNMHLLFINEATRKLHMRHKVSIVAKLNLIDLNIKDFMYICIPNNLICIPSAFCIVTCVTIVTFGE